LFLLILLAAALLLCLSVLCGWSWANQAHRERDRQQAAIQRQLNAEWRAIHAPVKNYEAFGDGTLPKERD